MHHQARSFTSHLGIKLGSLCTLLTEPSPQTRKKILIFGATLCVSNPPASYSGKTECPRSLRLRLVNARDGIRTQVSVRKQTLERQGKDPGRCEMWGSQSASQTSQLAKLASRKGAPWGGALTCETDQEEWRVYQCAQVCRRV